MQMTRFPHLQTPDWVLELRKQNGTYPATGQDQVKQSVNRTPPPPPAAPAGVQALQGEIAANGARQAEIRAELVRLDEEYQAAALRWDVDQDVTARTTMNACADKRRALQHELADLADELPRLQARLKAAQKAQRDAEHVEDLAAMERALDEFGPVAELFRQAAVDLVVLGDELVRRRQEIMRLRRKTTDWADHTGAAKCARDINAEAEIPPFFEAWLQGGARNVADCKRVMGITD